MQYKGELFGKVADKYIPLVYTSTDFDLLYETVKSIATGDVKAYGILAIDMARSTMHIIEDDFIVTEEMNPFRFGNMPV